MLERKKTISLHIIVSAAVVGTVIAVIFFAWYPSPYFRISGAEQVLRVLIGVDLVLGPLLTVVLYKPGKKGLWFDMLVIATVQLSALVYGTSVIYAERPQYVVFAVDRFAVLPETDLVSDGGPIEACPEGAPAPCLAVAVMPEDVEARNEVFFNSIEKGIELEQQPRYWQPLASARTEVLGKGRPLEALAAASKRAGAGVARVLDRTGRSADTLLWVPVVNKRLRAFVLVIDAETAEPVDVVDVDPWEPGK